MFDFIAGGDKADKYVFPEPIGEIRTRSISDIDQALKTIFHANVRDHANGMSSSPLIPQMRRADGFAG